jgi:peroxiredoxin
MNRQSSRSLRGGNLWTAAASAAALSLLSLAALSAAPAKTGPEAVIGRKVSPFRLPANTGQNRSLADYRDHKAVVLVFLGTQCPIANSYAEPLSQLAAKYDAKGVRFLGVNANPEEDLAAVRQHAQEYRLSFPVLKDEKQALAGQLAASVTPEAFVLDGERVVRYRGRIDDQYASRTRKNSRVKSRDLEAAIEAVLAGRPVPKAVTHALGCAIPRPEKSARTARVTYHKDVAPILQAACQGCHRPGQVAPFSLLTFADAKNWAQEIKVFAETRQMPPWKAEPGHGDFLDVRRLSDEQIATLSAWVEAGAPEGDRKDAPPAKEWTAEWMLGKPDLVLSMPEEFSVEATGDDVFRCFVLPTGLTEERDVVAVEIRPGNPRVVHHVLNFIDTSGRGRELDEKDPGAGYDSGPGGIGFFPAGGVGGWAPGNFPRYLPKGTGRRLPKGSDIVMQVHYHKTGKPEKDRTTVGLYFAKEPVEKQLRVWPLTNLFIDIPPGAARHEVKATMRVPQDVHAFAITPHMHLLGKEMKVWATLPDGTRKELVWIKDWDYRWQDSYRYREPVALPEGTRLDMVAYFDNSEGNPLNPSSPPKRVRFGEQTTDEMCFAFIEFTFDQEPKGQFNAGRLFGGR